MKPKYKKGDKVFYLPKISGLNNSKPLTISNVSLKADEFAKALGINKEQEYIYSFENSNLSATENQITKVLIHSEALEKLKQGKKIKNNPNDEGHLHMSGDMIFDENSMYMTSFFYLHADGLNWMEIN